MTGRPLDTVTAGHHERVPAEVLDKIPEQYRGANLYLMICDGDCLEPEIRHNDRALVVPGMPIRRDDFVVLWPKDQAQQPAIKRLEMAPPKEWEKWSPDSEAIPVIIVYQLNPPRRYVITTDKLKAIDRVVGTFPPDADKQPSQRKPTKKTRAAAHPR
jgi:hypothetical protein